MGRRARQHGDKRRLVFWLVVFFLTLSIPAGILIQRAYSQLKWEVFHRHRVMAEEFAARTDRRFNDLIRVEEARSFGDYAFLVVSGDPAANFLQRSALSTYPVDTGLPGLIGYFQIDDEGAFTTPLLPQAGVLPSAYGVSSEEFDQRLALEQRILRILDENRLVQGKQAEDAAESASDQTRSEELGMSPLAESDSNAAAPASPASEPSAISGQGAFDRLSGLSTEKQEAKQKTGTLGRVEDLKLDPGYQAGTAAARTEADKQALPQDERGRRKEQSAIYEQRAPVIRTEIPGATSTPRRDDVRIKIFESEIGTAEFALLSSGHFVLFRNVWREGQRYIQGALIEPKPFFDGIIATDFDQTALSRAIDLAVAYRGDVFAAYSGPVSRQYLAGADELKGALLYKTNLSAPLGGVELIFSITHPPAGPGGMVITWTAVILLLALSGGLALMYRLGAKHIDLTRQQQDFVAAVSHELKTPLTSIRMYGEMLREGWADDGKKETYYRYIVDESERLSRLIANVLQLARITRNDLRFDLKPTTAAALIDAIRAKVTSQVEGAGFSLRFDCSAEVGAATIKVDHDAFTQILINLVDNAIKFSAAADNKTIDIACDRSRDGTVRFRVRDFGPGVPRDQMTKIFKLFYRSESELTRETAGTGIGLALVSQLALAMHGRVDVVNRHPGAEFILAFPAV